MPGKKALKIYAAKADNAPIMTKVLLDSHCDPTLSMINAEMVNQSVSHKDLFDSFCIELTKDDNTCISIRICKNLKKKKL